LLQKVLKNCSLESNLPLTKQVSENKCLKENK
jgi:hypothetical protein